MARLSNQSREKSTTIGHQSKPKKYYNYVTKFLMNHFKLDADCMNLCMLKKHP